MAKHYIALCAFAAVVAVGDIAVADTLILANGTKIEGKVKDGGDVWVVRSAAGIVSRIPKHEVAGVKYSESMFDQFEKKWRELSVSDRSGDADAWYRLGMFAKKNSLVAEAKRAFKRTLELNVNHADAREALAAYEPRGSGKGGRVGLTWQDTNTRKKQPPVTRRERPAGSGLKFKNWVTCPKCNGTKYEVWLTCHQCDQSPRPGYLFFGNYVTICNRCMGKGKYPGFRCRYCGGHGKIDADNPPKPRERHVPGGYQLCMKCQGTGVETWIPCPQCSRSPWEGLLDMGEYVLLCNRCGGKGKLPGIRCADCKGHGIVPEKR